MLLENVYAVGIRGFMSSRATDWREICLALGNSSISGEQVHVSGLFGAGLTREHSHQRRLAFDQLLQGGMYIVEALEIMQTLAASAQLTWRLRPAQQEHAEQSGFSACEVEHLLQSMLILGYAAVGAARRSSPSFFLQTGERIPHGIFLQRHDRLAIVLLVASVYERIQRQRIVVGSRDVLLDERAKNSRFRFV